MDKQEFLQMLCLQDKGFTNEEMEEFTNLLNKNKSAEVEYSYFCQELGELLQASSKYILDKTDDNKLHFMEELGDAIIVIYNIAKVHGIDTETVNRCVKTKMVRHYNRI